MSWLKSKPSKAKRAWQDFARTNRVYIVPTKFGGLFIVGSLLMLLIGAAYQNNLVNLLGFFMLALTFTAMIATANNMKGIEISRVENVFGFANEELPVSLVIKNTTKKEKTNCDFTIRGFKKIAQYDARGTIPSLGEARLLASFQAPGRGLHPMRRFVLSSTAPFGLFYAWQYQPCDEVALVYPRRKGNLSWAVDQGLGAGSLSRAAGAEDFKDLRGYQMGDNLRRVDWRSYARGRPLMTKEYDEPAGSGLHFDFSKLVDLDPEDRLQQLSSWVDLAQKQGQSFVLSLPTRRLGPDQGLSFAHRAWSELARFNHVDSGTP